jgi:hypothetical protein
MSQRYTYIYTDGDRAEITEGEKERQGEDAERR